MVSHEEYMQQITWNIIFLQESGEDIESEDSDSELDE